jgi:hypothetical protein
VARLGGPSLSIVTATIIVLSELASPVRPIPLSTPADGYLLFFQGGRKKRPARAVPGTARL